MKKKRTDLIKLGSSYLTKEDIVNSLGEAETILAHVLDCPRMELYLDNVDVDKKIKRTYWDILTERAKGFPLQYLLGSVEFMGLKFKVAKGVFIPRPETEVLVETILKLSAESLPPSAKILDVGAGCGNIAISLAKDLNTPHIFACDISDFALQLTQENSYLNEVKIYSVKSDLLLGFKKQASFSLIVSNPPYIGTNELLALTRELQYEPKLALDGGADGLFYYRKIIAQAPFYLQEKGLLVLEIGDNQASAVKEILLQSGKFSQIFTVKDYNDVERVIIAQRQKIRYQWIN